MEEQLADFIEQRKARILPLLEAQAGGVPPSLTELRQVFGDRNDFTRLRACFESQDVREPLLRRQAAILYRQYLPHQVEPELADAIAALAARVSSVREHVRSDVGGVPLDWAGTWDLFVSSRNAAHRLVAWNRLRKAAHAAAPLLLELVALQNRAARGLGFEDHLDFSFMQIEVEGGWLEEILKQLVAGTETVFRSLKRAVGREAAAAARVRPANLRPWQYPHPFRLLPALDAEGCSRLPGEPRAAAFLKQLGLVLPVPERPPVRKRNAADAWDRLCGLSRSVRDGLPLVASRAADGGLPPLLRRACHPVLVEALWHLLLDDLARSASLPALLGASPQKTTHLRKALVLRTRRDQILLARFSAALWPFVKELYRHPGQDLAAVFAGRLRANLGIDLREDAAHPWWAALAEIQDAAAPSLLRLLGALAADQIRASLPPPPRGRGLLSDPDAMRLVKEQILHPGAARSWADTVAHLTGRPLGTEAFLARIRS